MIRFVIDEDMQRSIGFLLEKNGYEVMDIRDFGLRGKSDEEIFKFAQLNNAIILTGDRGFGNILRFPLGQHYGIVVANFPNEIPTDEINNRILVCLKELEITDFWGNLIIIEKSKLRIKRKQQ
ncbi:DUF5615 family PIN-like protein [bacterium]|nr:DUF5615 family PIN-like protein [bacterium]